MGQELADAAAAVAAERAAVEAARERSEAHATQARRRWAALHATQREMREAAAAAAAAKRARDTEVEAARMRCEEGARSRLAEARARATAGRVSLSVPQTAFPTRREQCSGNPRAERKRRLFPKLIVMIRRLLLLPHERFSSSLVFATVAHSAPSLGNFVGKNGG